MARNPKKALAAIAPGLSEAAGETVRPITLGMWAALERIGSPLVTGEEPKDALDLIPSLYLLTHDPKEVFFGNLAERAMDWADTKPVTAMRAIQRMAYAQLGAAMDVVPQSDEDEDESAKKKTTDGSPRSRSGRRGNTDGATMKSCGRPRSPRSFSSAGKSQSRQIKSCRLK